MALEVLGKAPDPSFAHVLLTYAKGANPELKAWALIGLGKIRHEESLVIAQSLVDDPSPTVRKAALETLMTLESQPSMDLWIHFLGDNDPEISHAAARVIRGQSETVTALLPFLSSPSRIVRERVLSILDAAGSPRRELSYFVIRELESAYRHLAFAAVLQRLEMRPEIALLQEHLQERGG